MALSRHSQRVHKGPAGPQATLVLQSVLWLALSVWHCPVSVPSHDELSLLVPPQAAHRGSGKPLLHLLGLKLFQGARTAYPRDTPIHSCPGQILRQAPPLTSHQLPFSTRPHSCLHRAFPEAWVRPPGCSREGVCMCLGVCG